MRIRPNKDSKNTHGELYTAIEVPDVPEDVGHLPEFFIRSGEVTQPYPGFFQPLPHTEIRAWAANSGFDLTNFEAAILRQMSDVHAAMLNRSEQDEPCPVDVPDGMLQSEEEMFANLASWRAMAIVAPKPEDDE